MWHRAQLGFKKLHKRLTYRLAEVKKLKGREEVIVDAMGDRGKTAS